MRKVEYQGMPQAIGLLTKNRIINQRLKQLFIKPPAILEIITDFFALLLRIARTNNEPPGKQAQTAFIRRIWIYPYCLGMITLHKRGIKFKQ